MALNRGIQPGNRSTSRAPNPSASQALRIFTISSKSTGSWRTHHRRPTPGQEYTSLHNSASWAGPAAHTRRTTKPPEATQAGPYHLVALSCCARRQPHRVTRKLAAQSVVEAPTSAPAGCEAAQRLPTPQQAQVPLHPFRCTQSGGHLGKNPWLCGMCCHTEGIIPMSNFSTCPLGRWPPA